MELWLGAVIVVLLIIILILCIHLYLVRKSVDEILEAFQERLTTDTNVLIDLSSRDKKMRRLASGINQQLRILRKERLRYQVGNHELQDAITNVSHDLRTPLTAIYGYLELLKKEEQTQEATGYIDMIENRADALKILIEELFEYTLLSSVGDEKRESLSLNAVMEECIASFYGVMKQRNIEPVIEIPEKEIKRTLNKVALYRVFENIIGNALKYSDGDLAVTMSEKGEISVSNQAKELDTVTVEKLFNRFFTVQSGRNSTGIGLSIAKLLTQQEGGTIKAHYEEQRLSIIVCFPDNMIYK